MHYAKLEETDVQSRSQTDHMLRGEIDYLHALFLASHAQVVIASRRLSGWAIPWCFLASSSTFLWSPIRFFFARLCELYTHT